VNRVFSTNQFGAARDAAASLLAIWLEDAWRYAAVDSVLGLVGALRDRGNEFLGEE